MRLYRHHSGSVKAEVSLGIKELNLSMEERINAAAAAKSLQSCPTLCDPIDGSHQAPRSLGPKDALEKEMATHSSVLAWRIPGTGKPGGLPSMGSHRVGHD